MESGDAPHPPTSPAPADGKRSVASGLLTASLPWPTNQFKLLATPLASAITRRRRASRCSPRRPLRKAAPGSTIGRGNTSPRPRSRSGGGPPAAARGGAESEPEGLGAASPLPSPAGAGQPTLVDGAHHRCRRVAARGAGHNSRDRTLARMISLSSFARRATKLLKAGLTPSSAKDCPVNNRALSQQDQAGFPYASTMSWLHQATTSRHTIAPKCSWSYTPGKRITFIKT